MPEAEQIVYPHKELTEVILRDRGITSGHWAIFFKLRLQGANLGMTDEQEVKPAAITFIEAVGIQRVDQPMPLAVDASKINRPRSSRARSKQRAERATA